MAHLFFAAGEMRPTDTTTDKLWRIAEPVCTAAGYELVDIVLTQSPSGWVLRVFIDNLPEQHGADTELHEVSRISFADCERVSHELSAVLDVEDPISQAYNLEVSSPGLDRSLRTRAHFERFMGQEIKLTLRHGLAGRRNFKGTMVSLGPASGTAGGTDARTGADNDVADTAASDEILTINVDGTDYRLPFRDIESARLVPNYDALFQRDR